MSLRWVYHYYLDLIGSGLLLVQTLKKWVLKNQEYL